MFRGSLVVTVNTRAGDRRERATPAHVVHVHHTLDEGLTIQSGTPGPSLVKSIVRGGVDFVLDLIVEGYEHPDAGPEVLARLFEHLASRIREETAMWSAGQPSPDDDPPDQESPGQ